MERALASYDDDQPAEDGLAYRVAPHNIDAEQHLLGAILVNNEAFDRVAGFLEPQHFYDPLHGRIFEALTKLISTGHIATPVTLKSFFEQDEALADIGGPQYLARLAASATSIINAAEYGRTIYDLAIRRELIHIGEDLYNKAYDSPIDLPPSTQIMEAEQALYSLAERGKYEGGFQAFHESIKAAIDMAAAAYERDGGLSGISTGLKDLDQRLGGLQPSDLIILAVKLPCY